MSPPSWSMTAPTTPAGSRRITRFPSRTRCRRPYPSSPAIRSSPSAPAAPTAACTQPARSFISTPHAVRTPRAWVLGANTRLPPAIALQWAGEVRDRFSCAAHGHPPHLPLLHSESQCALGAAAHARGVDPSAASTPAAMHAAAQVLVGEHDFSAFRSVECQSKTSGQARRADRGAARRRLPCGWRSRRTPTCITWCATSSVRCSRCSAKRTRRPPWRGCWPAASAAWPASPRRPRGLYLWRVEYPPSFGIPPAAAVG